MTDDNQDIASLKQALAAAERALDEARAENALIEERSRDERREELRRLRNLFSVIRAVARQTGEDVDTVEDYCGVLDGRLAAYLSAQAAVMQNWRGGADLALLLAGALQPFGLKEGERVNLVGPSVQLTSQAAGIMALAFHELALAASLSYRLDEPGGGLQIEWRLGPEEADRSLLIDWVETGQAEQQEQAQRSSWADWVEQAIEYQLAGTLTTQSADRGRAIRLHLPRSAMC